MNKEIKLHMKWAKKMGYCSKCIHPWFDQLCDCGNYVKHIEKMKYIFELYLKTEER